MSRKNIFRFALSAALITFTGCASASLAPHGAAVKVVNSISEADLGLYENLGQFEVKGMESIEDCYRDLRNQAGDKGAEIIRVYSTEADYCDIDFYNKGAEKRCYKMLGEGYRRKSSDSTAAKKSGAQPQI